MASVIKLGLIYFALAFAAGFVFGPLREMLITPYLGRAVGILIEAPFMLIVITGSANWIVTRYSVRSRNDRIGIGAVALGALLLAETFSSMTLRGISFKDFLAGFSSLSGIISMALFLAFAAMPIFVPQRQILKFNFK